MDIIRMISNILEVNIFLYENQVEEKCLVKFENSKYNSDPITILFEGGENGYFKLIKFHN